MTEHTDAVDTGEVVNPYFSILAGHVSVGSCRDDGADIDERAVAELRASLSEVFSWGIPNVDAIQTIVEAADGRTIFDAGAGTGYWAWMLERFGADVLAVDHSKNRRCETWTRVVRDDAVDAVKRFEDTLLLLVWPPYDDPFGVQCLDRYPGRTVAYVGEGRGACTASDDFHARLWDDWRLTTTVDIPTYPRSNDRLEIWERRE